MRKMKYWMIAAVMMVSVASFGQDSTYLSNEYAKAMAVYNQAQLYNDIEVQKAALYDMLVLDPGDSSVMRTLSEYYYNNRRYTSSALVAMDLLKKYPGNMVATEIAALSYEQLRIYDKAIEYYQEMWLKLDDNNILYQIAYLQYSIKRYEEANTNIGILESKLKDDAIITLTKQDGSTQDVKFKAALKNLSGLMSLDQGNKEDAKARFNEALALSPDFEAAKMGLAEASK
ncbi:tetratricopeptide repeat protein [uncultured Roseivirga sp.]|uniref:tetratricopeptide repeat protein n=1 Tax=uncultured Roseivirga sp. TaxID=543088 RepID=UPI0030DDD8B9|tara:strand:- start:22442 stop:23131 length:690 start_codon:yes stop_codon:yes gene_type:complete